MKLRCGPEFLGMAGLALCLTAFPALADEPAVVAAPSFKVGDAWVFDRSIERGATGYASERLAVQVEQLREDVMVIGIKKDGAPGAFEDQMVGQDWSKRRTLDGEETVVGRPFDFPMSVGKTWKLDVADPTRKGAQLSSEVQTHYKVVGWEDVTTPAGSFHALRVEASGKIKAQMAGAASTLGGSTASNGEATVIAHSQVSGPHAAYFTTYEILYYVPSIKYYVKRVEEDYNSENVRVSRMTDVLASLKPAS